MLIEPESLALLLRDDNDSLSYEEAIDAPDREFWKPAIESELSSIEKNKTWALIPRKQAKNILTIKWVFKVKDAVNPDKTVTEKAKARLLVRGF